MNMLKALKGETDPEAMEVYTRIAGCLRKKGKYDLAIKILKRALKSYREVLGDTRAQRGEPGLRDFRSPRQLLTESVSLSMGDEVRGVETNDSRISVCGR